MQSPLNEVKIRPTSVKGLEEVFEVAPVPEPVTPNLAPVPEPVTCADSVPVEQAAIQLKTSVNALKKRLRKGTVRGYKVETRHGEKWFVDSTELALVPEPVTSESAPVPEPVTRNLAPVPEPVTCAVEIVPEQAEPVVSPGLVEHLQELERKLEAATYRNGYLEAENEGLKAVLGSKEAQIKLLTDSQHKAGWWVRFSSWFRVR